ncbi:MAG: hypothetical protein JOY82_04050 [Streptosporangiaceae bacterium]|nr:hypothetical protein [Streptosporangiaceae bacterium]MBV9853685.1 hypothetical protein [Streptosporangiaceae bacterium]
MNRSVGGTLIAGAGLVGAGIAGAAGAVKWLTSKAEGVPGDRTPRNRWLMVTVNCPPGQFPAAGDLPEPVAKLTDRAEVTIRPAPGDRGTELGMRLLEQPPAGVAGVTARLSGADPRQEIRSALRDAKSLIETGEVIKPDEPTTHPTPAGKLFDFATRRAGGEGRL